MLCENKRCCVFSLNPPRDLHFQFLIPSAGLQATRNRVGRTSSDWSIKINYQESTVQPSSGALLDVAIFEHDFGFHFIVSMRIMSKQVGSERDSIKARFNPPVAMTQPMPTMPSGAFVIG